MCTRLSDLHACRTLAAGTWADWHALTLPPQLGALALHSSVRGDMPLLFAPYLTSARIEAWDNLRMHVAQAWGWPGIDGAYVIRGCSTPHHKQDATPASGWLVSARTHPPTTLGAYT